MANYFSKLEKDESFPDSVMKRYPQEYENEVLIENDLEDKMKITTSKRLQKK